MRRVKRRGAVLLLSLVAAVGCGNDSGRGSGSDSDSEPGEFRARCGTTFIDPTTGEDLPGQTYTPCPEDE